MRIRELTAADMSEMSRLPSGSTDDPDPPCASCVFWEVPYAARGGAGQEATTAKVAWWQAQELERPTASRAAWSDGQLVGWALAGEPAALPRARRMPSAPSDDALVLAVLWVDPQLRTHGVGRALLHSVLRDAVRRQRRAVEAYGDPSGQRLCAIDVKVLEALGFETVSPHPTAPRMRLDLRSTVSWADSVAGALDRVVSALARRERRAAAPARDVSAVGGPAGGALGADRLSPPW